MFLLEGSPGTGKTTIASQFLRQGAESGQPGLYITLSETEDELRAGAASHGWEFPDAFKIYELVPPESLLDEDQQQSLLYSSDLELGETTKRIFEAFERIRPSRVVLDSLSKLAAISRTFKSLPAKKWKIFDRTGETKKMLEMKVGLDM